jgi:hypothetical protein
MKPSTSQCIQYKQMETTPRYLGTRFERMAHLRRSSATTLKPRLLAKAKEIYQNFGISDGSTEPHYHNQNAAEQEIQDVKKDIAMILNITNTPYEWWPLCVEYIAIVKNHTARPTLGNHTPMERPTGQTPDVSKLLQYRWWEPVYFLDEEGWKRSGDGLE